MTQHPRPATHLEEQTHPLQTLQALLRRIEWFNLALLYLIPVWAFHEIPRVPLCRKTLLWSLLHRQRPPPDLHRAHHRYTDTPHDPYNIKRGFWHAHTLWALRRQSKPFPVVDVTDLTSNSIAVTQHKCYRSLCFVMGWVFPALVATFCVNSFAHWVGKRPFSDRLSARDNVPVAVVTLGVASIESPFGNCRWVCV
ncbi:hypothetical protein BO71DRAFT_436520 [Aspergillus ellipticus CBS 707.79]|uniref:Uncharacterized protein n=1 Tax=Aspergillus ellipticus CBS 707.79 TaxID=1448320 RepID=A0A319CQR5_9EURO|nr:hypothetical protein BO71DRAFT_436520 [Aspergillus ellipticus CBS 707.79]